MSFAGSAFLPFLALVVGLFVFVPRRWRTSTLLLASYAFYCQAHLPHALLLAGSTLLDFFVGRALGRATDSKRRKALLGLSLAVNLGALALFKYSGFAVENVNAVLARWGIEGVRWPALVLPLGISFYTFQTLAYTIDVYRRKIEPCRDLVAFALYVSFFPQLVAGPIERAGRLLPQLQRLQPLRAALVSRGGRLLLWGLYKKLVLADNLRVHVMPVFAHPEEQSSFALVLAAVSMNVVLYLDFSAYTDLARGAAALFGVDLVQNFRRPFLARSMNEFLSRWHMSLTSWIADYVYSPLSSGPPSHRTVWRNNLLTMTLFGLWHGASWTFLTWGFGVGVAISLQHSWRLWRARRGRRETATGRWKPKHVAFCAGTILYASIFIVLFFSPDLDFAGRYFGRILAGSFTAPGAWEGTTLGALALGYAVHAYGEFRDPAALWERVGAAGRWGWILLLCLLLLFLRTPESQDFIYFRF